MRLRYQIPAFAAARIVMNTMHRMAYPFLAVFGRGLGVDLPLLSLAMTARSATGMVAPFLASVADSRGRKTGMLLGLLLFSLGMGLVALWPAYPAFLAALILTVVGKNLFDPSMQAYVGDRVPYQRRGFVLAFTETGWSLSFILGVPLVGLLIARYGWQGPFPVLAVLGALSIALLGWMLPKDPRPPDDHPGIGRNLGMVIASRAALSALALVALCSAANETINLIFGVWLEDAFSLKIAALGAASAVIGLSELGGEGLTAALADRLGKPRAVGLGLAANSLAALALPFLGRTIPGAMAGLFLFYISFEFTVVSSIPMMTEILPQARATFMAASVAGHFLGRSLGALLAAPAYSFGILGNCLGATGLNLLAFVALAYLAGRIGWSPHPSIESQN